TPTVTLCRACHLSATCVAWRYGAGTSRRSSGTRTPSSLGDRMNSRPTEAADLAGHLSGRGHPAARSSPQMGDLFMHAKILNHERSAHVREVKPLFIILMIFGVVGETDGTHLAYGPDRNLPRLLTWLADLDPTQAEHNPGGVPDGGKHDLNSRAREVALDARQRPGESRRFPGRTAVETSPIPFRHRTERSAVRNDHTTPPTTDDATSTEVWTEQRIRALGAITDLRTAGRIFGL